jgi:hypothetical protein
VVCGGFPNDFKNQKEAWLFDKERGPTHKGTQFLFPFDCKVGHVGTILVLHGWSDHGKRIFYLERLRRGSKVSL